MFTGKLKYAVVNCWQRTYSLREITVLALVIIVLASAAGWLLRGWSAMYDGETFMLTILMCVVFSVAIIKCDRRMFPMVMVLAAYFVMMIFPRLLGYLWFPDIVRVWSLPGAGEITEFQWLHSHYQTGTHELNMAIGYVFIGAFLLIAGFVVATKIFHAQGIMSDKKPMVHYPLSIVLITMIVFSAGHIYLTVWLGNSVFSDILYGVDHKFIGVITMLIHPGSVLLIGLISIFIGRKKGAREVLSIVVIFILFTAGSVLGGSRAAPLSLVVLSLITLLVVNGEGRTTPIRLIVFFGMIFTLIVITWPLASGLRDAALHERATTLVSSGQEHGQTSERGTIVDSIAAGEVKIHIDPARILNRFCDLDYAIIPMLGTGDDKLISKYMTVLYGLKSAINISVPGVIFDGVNLNTAVLWPFIYGGRDTSLLNDPRYYESLPWTAWGLSYVMFGRICGLIALFVCGFILQAVFLLIGKLGGRYVPYLLAVWLTLGLSFFGNMGLDDWLYSVRGAFLDLLVIIVFMECLMRCQFKKQKCAEV